MLLIIFKCQACNSPSFRSNLQQSNNQAGPSGTSAWHDISTDRPSGQSPALTARAGKAPLARKRSGLGGNAPGTERRRQEHSSQENGMAGEGERVTRIKGKKNGTGRDKESRKKTYFKKKNNLVCEKALNQERNRSFTSRIKICTIIFVTP